MAKSKEDIAKFDKEFDYPFVVNGDKFAYPNISYMENQRLIKPTIKAILERSAMIDKIANQNSFIEDNKTVQKEEETVLTPEVPPKAANQDTKNTSVSGNEEDVE